MTDADKTIYKICREQAGYTQERAAELLSCSVRQLARYEAGEVQVPDDLAYAMVRLYNSQYLAVEHLRLVSLHWRPAFSRQWRRYPCRRQPCGCSTWLWTSLSPTPTGGCCGLPRMGSSHRRSGQSWTRSWKSCVH